MKITPVFPKNFLQNVLSAVLCLLIGIGFVFSFIGFELVSIICGALVFLYGLCRLILVVRYRAEMTLPFAFVGGFCYSILLCVAGVLMVFNAEGTVRLFALIVGLYLMIKAGFSLIMLAFSSIGAATQGSDFWFALVVSAITFALGVFLTVSPENALRAAAIPVGILMILQGAKDLYTEIRRFRTEKPEQTDGYIEADFEDKTDKN